MNTHRSILMLLLAAALSVACEENGVQDISEPVLAGARVRFFNFGVGSPGVNFYANDQKVTAISATTCAILTDANRENCTTLGAESTSGVTYGGVGSAGYYSVLAPGQYTLVGRIAATTDKDLAISTLTATLEDGKYYSFFQSGIYNTAAKTVEAFVVEDPIPAVADYAVAYVRFVHASSNANAMTLYATDATTGTETAVGALVAYKAAGAFTALAPGAYNLGARYSGSATNAISRTNVSFTAGRVYTITARGNITVASTVALDNTANR